MIAAERSLHTRVTLHDAGGVFVRHLHPQEAASLLEQGAVAPAGTKAKIYRVNQVPEKPAFPVPVDLRPRCRAAIERSMQRIPSAKPLVHHRESDTNPPRVQAFEVIGRKERRIFMAPLFDCGNGAYRDHLQLAIA